MAIDNFVPDSNSKLVQLNLLIVEDSVSYSIELEQLATKIGYNVIGVTDNSADALDIIFSQQPDIVLMDINIKGRLSGIEIGKRIHHLDIPILYITSYDDKETYQEALSSNLVGYIVKPVDNKTLATSLKLLLNSNPKIQSIDGRAHIKQKQDDDFIFFMKNNVYQKVKIPNIEIIKSEDNYCSFTLEDGTNYLLRIKLNAVEDLLKDYSFIRCHRQYIVNKKKIRKVDVQVNSIQVGNNDIPFSRSKKQEIMKLGIFIR